MTNNTSFFSPRSITLLVLLMIAMLIALGVAIGATWQRAEFNAYFESLPQCETEDSVNCYWDGGSNGQGLKFIDLQGEVHTLP